MQHLKLFSSSTDYEAAKDNFNSDVPYVALTEDDETIWVSKVISANDLPGPYVKIGDIEWASCNLGAEKPCDYGDYYMWGSTTANTNDVCSWATAPFNNESDDFNSDYFTKIQNSICNNGILLPKYDAIYQKTVGFARIPTHEELQSLYKNTTREVCYCDTALGHEGHTPVRGMLFTSKTDESKKIFIPFSGRRNNSSLYGKGSLAVLWSSSIVLDNNKNAYIFYSYSDDTVGPDGILNRYYGLTLRGVKY